MTNSMTETAPFRTSTLTVRTVLFAVLCALLWSGAFVSGKFAIGSVDAPGFGPFRLAFFRFAVAGGVLALWALWRDPASLRVRREDYGLFARLALLGMGLTYVLNYAGLALSSGTAATLITASGPVWVTLLAALFLKERMTVPRVFGTGFGLAGTLLVVWSTQKSGSGGGSNPLLGNVLMLLSLLFEAGAFLTVKQLTARYSGYAIVTVEFLVGSLLLAPFAAYETWASGPLHLTASAWGGYAYLLTACTLIAYPLWFRLLETADASDVTPFLFLQPVAGIVISIVLLHEPFTPFMAAGAFLVLLGAGNLAASGKKNSP